MKCPLALYTLIRCLWYPLKKYLEHFRFYHCFDQIYWVSGLVLSFKHIKKSFFLWSGLCEGHLTTQFPPKRFFHVHLISNKLNLESVSFAAQAFSLTTHWWCKILLTVFLVELPWHTAVSWWFLDCIWLSKSTSSQLRGDSLFFSTLVKWPQL